MRALGIPFGLAIALVGTACFGADEKATGITKGASNAPTARALTDADLLRCLQEILDATEKLQKETVLRDPFEKAGPPNDVTAPPPPFSPPPNAPQEPAVDLTKVLPELGLPDSALAALRAPPFAGFKPPDLILEEIRARRDLSPRIARATRVIANAQAKLGDLTAASRTWQRANTNALLCGDQESVLAALADIAADQAAYGDRAGARKSLRAARPFGLLSLPGPGDLPSPLAERDLHESDLRQCLVIASVLDKISDHDQATKEFDLALRSASAITNPVRRVAGLAIVAVAQRRDDARSTWDRAKSVALSLPDPLERMSAMETIARSSLQAGHDAWLIAALENGLAGQLQTYVLWAVADELAAGKRMPTADTVSQLLKRCEKTEFDPRSKKQRVFARIAVAQARLGNDEAFRTFEANLPAGQPLDVSDLRSKVDMLEALARAYLGAGKRDSAKDTIQLAVEAIDPILNAERGLSSVVDVAELVRLQAETGDLVGAGQTAELVEHRPSKIAALAAAAEAQGKVGDVATARKTLERARVFVDSVTTVEMWLTGDVRGVDRVFRVATSNPAKEAAGSLALIKRAQEAKAVALHAIASAQLKIGDTDAALATADEIKRCGDFAMTELIAAYSEIAAERIAAHDFKAAGKALSGMEKSVPHKDLDPARGRGYYREITKQDLSQGQPPRNLRDWVEFENRLELAAEKVEVLSAIAEEIAAFKGEKAFSNTGEQPATR